VPPTRISQEDDVDAEEMARIEARLESFQKYALILAVPTVIVWGAAFLTTPTTTTV
jgi:hypothetical protein